MTKVKKGNRSQKQSDKSPFNNYWIKENYFILFGGIFLLIIGFILMGQNPYDSVVSLSVSPVVLLIAYLVIIPFSILFIKRKTKE